jgi:hypothetical protein
MENEMNEKESDITNEVKILDNLERIDNHLFFIKMIALLQCGVFIITICALPYLIKKIIGLKLIIQ